MKVLRIFLWWIFILSIPVLLVSTIVRLEIQCLPFYEYQYQKYHISEVTGFNDQQLRVITRHLIQYFNDEVESAQFVIDKNNKPMYLFHDYELVHLEEVKEVFQYVYRIQFISLGYFLFYFLIHILGRGRKKMNHFWTGLRNGSILTIGMLTTLGIFIFFGFYQLFIQFHYLVFGDPQHSPWILDPRTDYLVMMYPLGFWQDATILGVITIIAISLILIGMSWLFLRGYRRRKR